VELLAKAISGFIALVLASGYRQKGPTKTMIAHVTGVIMNRLTDAAAVYFDEWRHPWGDARRGRFAAVVTITKSARELLIHAGSHVARLTHRWNGSPRAH
jgi:hypothetical protein